MSKTVFCCDCYNLGLSPDGFDFCEMLESKIENYEAERFCDCFERKED